jgi:pyruvate-formate lyase-activating enzyme
MTEKAVWINNAEEHILAARRKLRLSLKCLSRLATIVATTDPEVELRLLNFASEIDHKLDNLDCEYLQRRLREFSEELKAAR